MRVPFLLWRDDMFKILVADDDKNIRKYIKAVLEAENYTVFTCSNGEEALEILDKEYIDLIVLDVMMPKMNGYELTRALRETRNDIPILMVSAMQLPEDRHKGFISGKNNVGGIVGEVYDSISTTPFSYCENSGSVIGEEYVGGIVGYNEQ